MKGLVTIRTVMTEPEPEPLPIAVRLVKDTAPKAPSAPAKTDYFYPTWDRFLSVQPKRAKRTSRASRKLEPTKAAIAADPGADGLRVAENAATSWEQAAAECRAKVAAIVEECTRLNQKYRDALFNPEESAYCFTNLAGEFCSAVDEIDAPPWVKRVEDIFDKPQFFVDGATPTDIHQGSGGDCWFLAALMAISAKKELIDDVCVMRNEKVGVYGFVFYRDGEWIYEVIDDKLYLRVGNEEELSVIRDWNRKSREGTSLPHDSDKLKETLQRGGKALYFSHCNSDETWLPLIEKAYAKAHGDYCAIEGGSSSEAIEDLTGGVAVVINPEDIMDKDRFWTEQLSKVNELYLFGGGTHSKSSKGFVGGHAYTVLRVYEEGDLKLLKLRNPWGEGEWEGDWSDGSKMWTPELMTKLGHAFGNDGVFWISYKDFLKHFHHINRVRLFNKEWKVAQQWTCVSVPWTPDYLDTEFELTVTERGPLVIVLSQPDERYFYGLEGRYMYSLHFRVYKKGSDRYLVRSMHNSGNAAVLTRSVSAELDDVEPGTYSVIFKVTASRTAQLTAAEAINQYAKDRKDKVLEVGRRYDYAQSKGNLRAMEKAHEKDIRDDARAAANKQSKKGREVSMKNRVREKLRKQRIADAMEEERKKKAKKTKKPKKKKDSERGADTITKGEDSHTSKEEEGGPPDIHSSPIEYPDQATSITEDSSSAASSTPPNSEADTTTTDTDFTLPPAASPPPPRPPPRTTPSPPPEHPAAITITTSRTDPPAQTPTTANPNPTTSPSLAPLAADARSTTPHPPAPLPLPLPYIYPPDDPFNPFAPALPPALPPAQDLKPPSSPLTAFQDDDFPWDEEIDGPAYASSTASSDSDDEATGRRATACLDRFNEDPWHALVVLGLRVYSKGEVGLVVRRDDGEGVGSEVDGEEV